MKRAVCQIVTGGPFSRTGKRSRPLTSWRDGRRPSAAAQANSARTKSPLRFASATPFLEGLEVSSTIQPA